MRKFVVIGVRYFYNHVIIHCNTSTRNAVRFSIKIECFSARNVNEFTQSLALEQCICYTKTRQCTILTKFALETGVWFEPSRTLRALIKGLGDNQKAGVMSFPQVCFSNQVRQIGMKNQNTKG